MLSKFQSLCFHHKNCAVTLREKISLRPLEIKKMLTLLAEIKSMEEFLILSTCNRTEFYYVSEQNLSGELISLLAFQKGFDKDELKGKEEDLSGFDALRHLYRVSFGLESKLSGDAQIFNQVKMAYQMATEAGTTGPIMHKVMHAMFYAHKRVVNELPIKPMPNSLSGLAAQMAKNEIKHYHKAKIAIVGLGEMGISIAKSLKDEAAEVFLLNRNFEKAFETASQFGFSCTPIEKLEVIVPDCDVLIFACYSDAALLDRTNFKSNDFYHKLIIDLSMPRVVNPNVKELSNISLLNVDELCEIMEAEAKERESYNENLESLIHQSLADLKEWALEMEFSPVLKDLKARLETIRREELAKVSMKMGAESSELIDAITTGIINKLMKYPAINLKMACKRGEAENLSRALLTLFEPATPLKV